MSEWIRHDRGFIANLYYIKKMLGYESIDDTREAMMVSFVNQTLYPIADFREYVNSKRQFIATVLGEVKYF